MSKMRRLRKILHLSTGDRRLLVQSVLLLGAIRLGLWLIPFRTLLRLLASLAQKQKPIRLRNAEQPSTDQVGWAVATAGRYVPLATCLTQALATQVLLARRGCMAHLHIGVAKGDGGQLESHAWLETQGKIVIGGLEDLGHFTPLPPLEGGGR